MNLQDWFPGPRGGLHWICLDISLRHHSIFDGKIFAILGPKGGILQQGARVPGLMHNRICEEQRLVIISTSIYREHVSTVLQRLGN